MISKLKTIARHVWFDADDSARLVPKDMLQRITARVAASEQRHSGEIRICVEAALPWSYLRRLGAHCPIRALTRQRAITLFGKLGVWDTERNNGVLIYVLLAEHAIEIVADRGLAQHVPPAHWNEVVARMSRAFQAGRYEDGLTEALEATSAVLMQHFSTDETTPGDATPDQGNPNELPDNPLLL